MNLNRRLLLRDFILPGFLFLIGALLYTWPAVQGIFLGDVSSYMSDGTDPTTLPYSYEKISQAFHENPALAFYGAVPIKYLSAPEGSIMWTAGVEKFGAVLLSFLFQREHLSAALVFVLMVMNGMAFYLLGRSYSWNPIISFALGAAWAFSPFTRARAQVHPSLVGIFAFPLCLLGLHLLQKADLKKPNKIFLGIAVLGICGLSPHYYLIYLAILSPFWLLYYFSASETRINWKKSLGILLLASLPTVAFLGFGATHPAPAEAVGRAALAYPKTGEGAEWPHPFLSVFMATPGDYFTGDVAIASAFDWNPIKNVMNNSFRQELRQGNYHEHAEGIRWTVWLVVILGAVFFYRTRQRKDLWSLQERILSYAFLGLAAFAFLSSLEPDWGFMWGPSAWIHKLVAQIRTPNRMAIIVHFSVLFLSGLFLTKWLSQSKWQASEKKWSWIFLGLVLLEFPPFMNSMPMAPVSPLRVEQFKKKPGACGLGYHFPHASGAFEMGVFYYFLQSLRGTDCYVLNPSDNPDRDLKMAKLFSYQNSQAMQAMMGNDPRLRDLLLRFANCNQLDWIVFDPRAPADFTQGFCKTWGGQWVPPDLCRNNKPAVIDIPIGLPDRCLKEILN